MLLAVTDSARQGFDGLALVTLRLIVTDEFEIHKTCFSPQLSGRRCLFFASRRTERHFELRESFYYNRGRI